MARVLVGLLRLPKVFYLLLAPLCGMPGLMIFMTQVLEWQVMNIIPDLLRMPALVLVVRTQSESK